jgi:hypothetical protein
VRRRAELYYQQLDALVSLRPQARRKLLAESKKDSAGKWLRSIPALGPIRVALRLGIVQTPHRFRSKRPLWRYSDGAVGQHRPCLITWGWKEANLQSLGRCFS